jgi:hypothetical protein
MGKELVKACWGVVWRAVVAIAVALLCGWAVVYLGDCNEH